MAPTAFPCPPGGPGWAIGGEGFAVDRLAAVGTPGTRSGKGAGSEALVVEEKSFEAFIVGGSLLDACVGVFAVDMTD